MALSKELLHLLNDKSEPLAKRLKIADNAFNSFELPLQRKEAFLFKWLSKATKANDKSTWDLLLNWLRSPQIQSLSRNDITNDDLQNLVNVITKRYKHEEHATIITDCVIEIVQNKTFQMIFKHDLLGYCRFVSGVALKIPSSMLLNSILINDQLFHRHITCGESFHLHFFNNTLPVLVAVSSKFKNEETFLEVSKLLDKCLFQRNFNVFSDYFKCIFGEGAIEHALPNLLLANLLSADAELYKLVFHSFCASYDNFATIYSFFVVLLQVLGFKMDVFFASKRLKQFVVLDKSVSLMTTLCGVLCERTCELSLKLNEKSFTECLEYVLSDVLVSVESSVESYEFLNKIILLHPLILKTHLDEVLAFVLNDKNNVDQRDMFILGLFEVFAKLHQIPTLVNAMIKIVKEKKLVDSVNLSQVVLSYFAQCITSLASWQILELYKSLLLWLDDAVANIGHEENSSYVEFISMFLCQFIMSVRIAEHTVPSAIVRSFVKGMMELKEILKKFGTRLVRLEHNPCLMQTYLNLCLKWGDLYIILVYYATCDEMELEKSLDNDYFATNITYLHSYLTREQWRLISQRIANFGEKPCKQVMQNLCVQKLKAMQLFETRTNPDVVLPVVANVLSSLDDQDEDLLFNQFVLQNLIIPNCQEGTAKVLIKNIVASKDNAKLQSLCDNPVAIGKVLYELLYRLNKTLGKHNRDQTLSSRVLTNIHSHLFEVPDLSKITETFKNENGVNCTVNETDLNTYLDLVKAVPVPQFEKHVVEVVFLYMVALRIDLEKCVLRDSALLDECENISIGIAQSLRLSRSVVAKYTMRRIIESFQKYDEVFNLCMQSLLRVKEQGSFHDVLTLILDNLHLDRYMHCATIFLHYLERFKNWKLPEDLRCYREKICEKVFSLVQIKDNFNIERLTEGFAFVLKLYLFKNGGPPLEELLLFVNQYVETITDSDRYIKGAVFFLSVVVNNKVKCKITDSTILKIWDCIIRLQINEEQHYFTKLITSTLQYVSEEDFCTSTSKLLIKTEKALNDGSFNEQLTIWTCISSCNLTSAQTKIWQNILELVLYRKLIPRLKQNQENVPHQLVQLQLAFLQNISLPLSASLLESVLIAVSLIATNESKSFVKKFNLCVLLLDSLIKDRKTLVVDYLPMYLQRYRTLLNNLCINSNSDLNLSQGDVQELADCAHKFEKLTKSLLGYDRALTRICPNLMADILKQFERLTIYPNVKIHLNNCLYKLLSLCDEHSVAYLKRVLSTASTEMFKVVYENYNKYYKFTGKV